MIRKTLLIITISLIVVVATAAAVMIRFNSQETPAIPKRIYRPYIPGPNETIVAICFDDGWKSQLDAAQVLNTFGFRATFAIVSQYATDKYPAYMTWEEIHTLQEEGHDIECHSYSHIDLTNTTSNELDEQIVKSKQTFEAQGFYPELFVYPLGVGFDNATVRGIVSQNYLAARAVEDQVWDISDFDRFAITCITIKNDTSISDFENIAWEAGGTTIIVLLYHQLGTNGTFSTAEDSFVEQMSFLKSNGFTVKTLSELLFVTES